MSHSSTEAPVDNRSEAGPLGGRLSLLAVCVGFFVIQIDATAVNVALPSIAQGLGASIRTCSGWSTPTRWLWPGSC